MLTASFAEASIFCQNPPFPKAVLVMPACLKLQPKHKRMKTVISCIVHPTVSMHLQLPFPALPILFLNALPLLSTHVAPVEWGGGWFLCFVWVRIAIRLKKNICSVGRCFCVNTGSEKSCSNMCSTGQCLTCFLIEEKLQGDRRA